MMRTIERLVHRLRGDADIVALKKLGLRMGGGCSIQPQSVIDKSHCWLITIGNNVTLAPRAYVLAHDASTKRQLGYTRIGLVTIEDGVFIGAGAIIMPGVTVGKGSVVGAYSVVTKDVPAGVVVVGNPARIVCQLGEYMGRKSEELKSAPVYEREYTLAEGITADMKQEMREALSVKGGIGYVR